MLALELSQFTGSPRSVASARAFLEQGWLPGDAVDGGGDSILADPGRSDPTVPQSFVKCGQQSLDLSRGELVPVPSARANAACESQLIAAARPRKSMTSKVSRSGVGGFTARVKPSDRYPIR